MMTRLLSRSLALFSALLLATPAARPLAQTPDGAARLSFEVASVRENQPGDSRQHGLAPIGPGGRVTIVGLTARELMRLAYSPQVALLPSQIVGGPNWVDSTRFDISAIGGDQLPQVPNTSPGRIFALLRTLLEDRFALKAHAERRDMPIYRLVVDQANGKLGTKLRPSSGECLPPGAAGASVAAQMCGFRRVGPTGLSGHGISMEVLSGVLGGLPDVLRVVRDRTNLSGRFDIDLAFTSLTVAGNDPATVATDSGPTLFTALKEQLGLRLDSQRGPVDVYVIDNVEKPRQD
jgi:uncharacterized protein (TIGR03435 family)